MFSPKLSVETQRSESASICDSGCVASFPDAGSLPLFSVFEIIKLVCVCVCVNGAERWLQTRVLHLFRLRLRLEQLSDDRCLLRLVLDWNRVQRVVLNLRRARRWEARQRHHARWRHQWRSHCAFRSSRLKSSPLPCC